MLSRILKGTQMNYTQDQNPYQTNFAPDVQTAALADEWERTTFIRRTYSHLLGGIGFFVLLETLIFTMVSEAALDNLMRTMMGGRWNWLLVLGAFMVVSWIARSWAESTASQSLQYLGLGAMCWRRLSSSCLCFISPRR